MAAAGLADQIEPLRTAAPAPKRRLTPLIDPRMLGFSEPHQTLIEPAPVLTKPGPALSEPPPALTKPPIPAQPETSNVPVQALPESYGTEKLFLAARDPHWMYAAWDLTQQQLDRYHALSFEGHLRLRMHAEAISELPFLEIQVRPDSRNWFVFVGRGGTQFVAELGYVDPHDQWHRIAVSSPARTPRDTISEDTSVTFGSLTAKAPDEPEEAILHAAAQDVALPGGPVRLPESGEHALPAPVAGLAQQGWSPARQQALDPIVSLEELRREWFGSLALAEFKPQSGPPGVPSPEIGRPAGVPPPPQALFEISSPATPPIAELSSPLGEAERAKGFWFNINVELIVYGATEPDAAVTVAGRTVRLRPDGTFSFRFALPDGQYELPAQAVSADKTGQRAAKLRFGRATQYAGEVGRHPQDPNLRAPG